MLTRIVRTAAQQSAHETAQRKALYRGGKARGKFAPRRNQPAGNMVGSIHPDLAIQRAETRERNAELRELGLPVPKDSQQRANCSTLAFIVVKLRCALPPWNPAEHNGLQFPPKVGGYRLPGDKTNNEYIQDMLADCKRFNLILTRTSDAHSREIRGKGTDIEAMLRRSPEWIASWDYAIDAAIPRGIPAGSGPVGVGAKRRIAEAKREQIAKAEDREFAFLNSLAPSQPTTRTDSDRKICAAYLSTFGIANLLLPISWEVPVMLKRQAIKRGKNGKPEYDEIGNEIPLRTASGEFIQEWYESKRTTNNTTAEEIAFRMIGMEKQLHTLAETADSVPTDMEALEKLIAEFKRLMGLLQSHSMGGK